MVIMAISKYEMIVREMIHDLVCVTVFIYFLLYKQEIEKLQIALYFNDGE